MNKVLFVVAIGIVGILKCWSGDVSAEEKESAATQLQGGNVKRVKWFFGTEPKLFEKLLAQKFPFMAYACPGNDDPTPVIKYLLEKGVKDMNIPDKNGRCALDWATEGGHTEVVKLLLEKGANLMYKVPSTKCTPAHRAARYNHIEVMKLLLAQKDKSGKRIMDIDSKNKWGNTVLSYGLDESRNRREDFKTEEIFLLLIKEGADVKSVDDQKNTPLHYAAENNFPKTVETLIKKGADPNAPNKSAQTPLYFAVRGKAHAAAAALLKNGAKVDTMAMELAEGSDDNKMVDLLDKHSK